MCKVLRSDDMRGVFGIRYLRDAVCEWLGEGVGVTLAVVHQRDPYTVVTAERFPHRGVGVANKGPRDDWDADSGIALAATRAIREIADKMIADATRTHADWATFVARHIKDDNLIVALVAWRSMASAIKAHIEARSPSQD